MFEFIRPDTKIDFLGQRRFWIGLSLVASLVGLLAIPLRGIKYGVDFAGGTEMQLQFTGSEPVDEGRIRSAVGEYGIKETNVVRFGAEGTRQYLVKFAGQLHEQGVAPKLENGVEAELSPEQRKAALASFDSFMDGKVGAVDVQRVEFVGPKVGEELRRNGIYAIVVSWIAILIYVGFRFSPLYAPGAVIALIHDVWITAGLWVLLGFEFDLQVLAALLTIIGYSMNDTIIIYDRIRENLAIRTRGELEDVINRSVNQTLSRAILTHGTVFLAVVALDLLGGPVIRPFSLAMTFGVVVGAYSSIYIASPVLLWLSEWNRKRGSKNGGAGAPPSSARAPKTRTQDSSGSGRAGGRARSA